MPISEQDRPQIIGIVAGEVSGDILGAGLIKSLKQQHPNAKFIGVAGPLMKAEGCEALFEMEELAVMGVVEVLGRLPRILAIRKALLKTFTEIKPDVFVGIDAPDFNLTLEEKLKSRGIKTVHYVSPSVWAWRQKRIFKIARATDLVLALLPFEKAFYDKHNVPCLFVGHTLADQLPLIPNKQAARLHLNLDMQKQYLAILPGSRSAEVELLGPIFLATAKTLVNRLPELHFIVPMVNQARRTQFEQLIAKLTPDITDKIHIVDGQSREVLTASDATLLASGTATLECMLAKSPMVVGYRMKAMNYWIGKKLVKTKYISLPNLLADAPVVTELLQDECTVENITVALLTLLADAEQSALLKAKFTELHHLIRCDADKQAANAILGLIPIEQ